MNRRLVMLAACVLVVLALGIWQFARPGDEAGLADGLGSEQIEQNREDEIRRNVALRNEAGLGDLTEGALLTEDEGSPRSGSPSRWFVVPAEFELRCVDEEGSPVPQASIFVDHNKPDIELIRDDVDRQEAMRQAGQRFESDASGFVRLPASPDYLFILAETEQLIGFVGLSSCQDGDPRVITMERRVTLRVRCVDDKGEPMAGVAVRLEREATTGSFGTGYRSAEWTRAVSNDQGLLDLIVPPTDAHNVTERAWLRPEGLFWPSVAKEIDFRVQGDEEVTLVIPESGSLSIAFDLPEGLSIEPARLSLTLASPSLAEAPIFDYCRTLREGLAEFPRLGLGLEFELRVRTPPDSRLADQTFKISGPTSNREEKQLRLVWPDAPKRPILSGRLLWPDGSPVAAEVGAVGMDTRGGEGSKSQYAALRLDDAGRFQLACTDIYMGATQVDLSIQVSDASGIFGWYRQSLEPILNDRDLGDLRLAMPPIVVRGRVVDDRGEPVAGAAMDYDLTHHSWSGSLQYPGNGLMESGFDGRFYLAVEGEGGPIGVQAVKPGFKDARIEAEAGSDDLVIVLEREPRVIGRIIADDGDLAGVGFCSLATVDRSGGKGRRSSIAADGRFEIAAAPGRYRFDVVDVLGHRLLEAPLDVAVPESGLVDLGEIRVESQARNLRLEWTWPTELWAKKAQIDLADPTTGKHLKSASFDLLRHDSVLSVPHLPMRLSVQVAGAKPMMRVVEEAEVKIELELGPRFEIDLGQEFTLPDGAAIELRAMVSGGSRTLLGRARVGGRVSILTLDLSHAGRHRVEISGSRTNPATGKVTTEVLVGGGDEGIELDFEDQGRRLKLSLEPEQVETIRAFFTEP